MCPKLLTKATERHQKVKKKKMKKYFFKPLSMAYRKSGTYDPKVGPGSQDP